jgi:hypothetical protein
MYEFDSNEEIHFSWYLKQLLDNNIITDWSYHPKPFLLSDRIVRVYNKILKTKTVSKDSVILNDHQYQADFLIHWNPQWKGKFFMNIHELDGLHRDFAFIANKSSNFSVIDVKGSFAGPHNNSAITFPLDQKWVWQKYGIYVQKIVPKKLFVETFVPHRYLLTDTSGKARKIDFKVRQLLDYLVLINE